MLALISCGQDIGFSVLQGATEIVKYARFTSGSTITGSVAITADGPVTLKWDNTYSFMTAKDINYNVSCEDPANSAE